MTHPYDLYQNDYRQMSVQLSGEVEPVEISLYRVGQGIKRSKDAITAAGRFAYVIEEVLNWMTNHFKFGQEVGKFAGGMHRTLQGSLVNFCLGILTQLAEENWTDARNQKAIDLCRKVKKIVDDNGTQPFI